MNRSWRVARVAGIDLSVHWTFVALLAWVVLSALSQGGGSYAIREFILAIALFGCVVLHELGHALAARYFGIATLGITLLPIGGVASLERIPRKPLHELAIALAGPAVNVALLLLLVPTWLAFQLTGLSVHASSFFANGLLERLLFVNTMLIVFNLLPAFPMDGGRVLRAVLAWRGDYVRATRYATRAGQAVAILLACFGLLWNPMLILIALFVAVAGEAEYQHVLAERMTGSPTNDWGAAIQPVAVGIDDDRPLSMSSRNPLHPRSDLVTDPSWIRETQALRQSTGGPELVSSSSPSSTAGRRTQSMIVGIQLPHGIHVVRRLGI